MTLGPQYHISISTNNAVLQVQDNAYAQMIKPGKMTDPARVAAPDSAKLQPRGDLFKALLTLEKSTARLERALKKHNDLNKEKAIRKGSQSLRLSAAMGLALALGLSMFVLQLM